MQTYSAKPSEVEKKWVLFDAEGVILGRLASAIAMQLRGKTKPMFTPNIDCGNNVIVINAEKIVVTGKKLEQDKFFWHAGYPGGIKELTKGQIMNGRFPERVLEHAVERMMPKSKMGRHQFANLRVYAGSEHPHTAQTPMTIDFASQNPKNKKRG